jgi:hypothetical protein
MNMGEQITGKLIWEYSSATSGWIMGLLFPVFGVCQRFRLNEKIDGYPIGAMRPDRAALPQSDEAQ